MQGIRSRRIALAAWFVAATVLTFAPGEVSAQDAAATATAVEESLERCSKLVEKGKWKAARSAYGKLFEAHPRHPLIVAQAGAIEQDLQRCEFNADWKLPTGKELFGGATWKFSHRSRKLEIWPKSIADERYFRRSGAAYLLDVVWEGDVKMELSPHVPVAAVMCWDVEKRGGYRLVPGYCKDHGGSISFQDRAIHRIDPQGEKELFRRAQGPETPERVPLEFIRKGNRLRMKWNYKDIGKGSDGTYKRGYVGVFADLPPKGGDQEARRRRDYAASRISAVKVDGTVAKDHYDRVLSAYRTKAFEAWLKKGYDRTTVLPDWLASPPKPRLPAEVFVLPSDAGPEPHLARNLVGWFLEGDWARFNGGMRQSSSLPPSTRTFMIGLRALATREWAQAADLFRKLAQLDPAFAPADVFLARALIPMRDFEGARAALARAEKSSAAYPPILETRALLAYWTNDYDGAHAALREATLRGYQPAELRWMRERVARFQRGPTWASPNEHSTKHFTVTSDQSKELCRDLAKMLEASLTAFAGNFEQVLDRERSQVYVFSTEAAYLKYLEGIEVSLSGSAGVYLPWAQQIVLWVPEDRTALRRTARHEAFHQYMDNLVDNSPHWFDEGNAEYYEISGYEGGFLKTGKVHDAHAQLLRRTGRVKRLRSLSKLLRMDGAAFWKDRELTYAQSWALVQFLRHPPDAETAKRYRGRMKSYLDALRAGKTRDEAFEAVFAADIETLEVEYKLFIENLCQ